MKNRRRVPTAPDKLRVFWPWEKFSKGKTRVACSAAGIGPMGEPHWWRRPAIINTALRMERELRRTNSAAKRHDIRASAARKIAKLVET